MRKSGCVQSTWWLWGSVKPLFEWRTDGPAMLQVYPKGGRRKGGRVSDMGRVGRILRKEGGDEVLFGKGFHQRRRVLTHRCGLLRGTGGREEWV